MNFKMFIPKNDTEDLLLSITNNFETLFKQTHRKAKATRNFNFNKSRERIHFNPTKSNKSSWMLSL